MAHAYHAPPQQSTKFLVHCHSMANGSKSFQHSLSTNTAQPDIEQAFSEGRDGHGVENSLHQTHQPVRHLQQPILQHSQQLSPVNRLSQMQTLPSERVRPNILPSQLRTDSGPIQISDIPQQAHLETQKNVQEIRQGKAAELYSPSTSPGALTRPIAPVQSPSKMLQQTNQEKNTINYNVTNAVPAVSKHVSFQPVHDVHDISMVSVDGSPLRDRIVK